MARRSPSPSPILLVVILVLVFLYIAHNRRSSHEFHRRPERHARSSEPKLYPEGGEKQRGANAGQENCQALGISCTSTYFQPWHTPEDSSCGASVRNGYPVPDPRCTPGGINPTVTADILRDPSWRTRCNRNCESTEKEKHAAYGWYAIRAPRHNSGDRQVCELDHLVPLELGGADGLGNIWPECGPSSTDLKNRYFKIKDRVENYLADEVKAGRMPLDVAQRGIASDWTQFLAEANRYCASGGRC